ncbi:MAG: transporter substrate-binding domain-containing protein, partial [Firmicutes bacterium]|nr:transporter substrate-binding domain-containing protein [Bacillota bacterium]
VDMSDLFESPERLKKYSFTQPLYRLKGIAVTNAHRTDLDSIGKLTGLKIALVEDDFAVEHFNTYYPEEKTKNTYIKIRDMEEGLKLLYSQEIDALAGDDTVINYYASQMNMTEEIREIGSSGLYEKNVTFAVRKDDQLLLSILNKGILNLKKKNILVQAQNKWFHTSAPVITDINAMRWLPFAVAGTVIIILGFFFWQSIMDRKIAQRTREIQLQKDNQRTIIDNIHAMLFVVNQKNIITDVNQMAAEVLQCSPESLIGQETFQIPLLSALLDAHKKKPSPDIIHQLHGRYYIVFIRPLNAIDGSQLIVIEDQTEKTITEKRLRQESKMSAVGQLSAGLAHEIRNPLGLIKNYAYILNYSVEEDEVCSHALQVIGESTDRINSLIENLLSFSRLGDEKLSHVNLYRLVQNIAALERKKMEKSQIQLNLDCAEEATFYTSEETLKITLINLLNNAVDALTDDTERETQKWIRCRIETGSDELTIDISDNGPGIAEKNTDSLFVPFFTTKDYGTGLGLYTVSSELDKLGGTIQLDSEYKQGARFIVRIPSEQKGEPIYDEYTS